MIVNGDVFLELPEGTRFRDINLNTGKPCGDIEIKQELLRSEILKKVTGYYSKIEATGEETAAHMLCPSACKFLVLSGLGMMMEVEKRSA